MGSSDAMAATTGSSGGSLTAPCPSASVCSWRPCSGTACPAAAGPVLGYLHGLAARDDGVIIVGTMLLFPTTATIYGGIKVFFAAREAVRRESREKGRQEGLQEGIREGLQEGRQEERERIRKELAKQGVAISPELAKILNGDDK